MDSHFWQSVFTSVFVAAPSAYLGSLMLTRRMTLVGDAMGHVALPGMGLALLLGLDPSIGAFFALSIATLIIWRVRENTRLSIETLVGVAFVTSLALGFLLVPNPELLESLVGDLSHVSSLATVITILVSCAVLIITRRIYSAMMLLNVSEELAIVEGFKPSTYDLLYLTLITMIVSLGIKVTGSLLVGALLIVPAASARLIAWNISSYTGLCVAIGTLSSVCGVVLSFWTGFPAGPAIILANAAIFMMAMIKIKNRPG